MARRSRKATGRAQDANRGDRGADSVVITGGATGPATVISEAPFNGADPALFDHDGDGQPGGSKPAEPQEGEPQETQDGDADPAAEAAPVAIAEELAEDVSAEAPVAETPGEPEADLAVVVAQAEPEEGAQEPAAEPAPEGVDGAAAPEPTPTEALAAQAEAHEEEQGLGLIDPEAAEAQTATAVDLNVDPPAPEPSARTKATLEDYGPEVQEALSAMAGTRYGLYAAPKSAGWSAEPNVAVWSNETIEILLSNGWAWLDETGGNHGSAKITPAGRDALQPPLGAAA